MIAVVTSVYGGYDPVVSPPEQSLGVEWVCVTDGESKIPPPWRQIIEPRPHLHPRMAGKVARCRPDFYTDAQLTIWVDASARFADEHAVNKLILALGDGLIAQFAHPERSDIKAEAEVSAGLKKYRGQPMTDQVAHYNIGSGLWATGCIVRRNTPSLATFGDTWLVEMMRWSWQDQISEPYALALHGLEPILLPGNLWSNRIVGFDYSQRRRDD